MQKRNILNLSLSLIVASSLLAACGPVKTPVASNPGGNTAVQPNKPSGSTSASAEASAALSTELQAILADDAAMADTTSAADAGFSTQALNIPVRGEVSATGMLARPALAGTRTAVRTRARVGMKAETRAKLALKAQKRAEMARKNKAGLEASGAVTVNADGTVTVDPEKLKAAVKARLQNRQAEFKARLEKLKDKLAAKKDVAKDKVEKMRRKNNVVRSSDVQSVTNEDGSVTKTVSVDFKNEKTGVTRTVDSSRTTKDGKLVSAHYELHVTGPNGFKRDVVRDVQVAADGTRTASTEATTTWADGRTHSRSETRVFSADGSASATGTLTIKQKDGTTKTFDYTVGVEADGTETVNGDDAPNTSDEAAETVEVTVEDSPTTEDTTVVVEEGGSSTEETVAESDDADTEEPAADPAPAEAAPAEAAPAEAAPAETPAV